jgi:hypothetical protein
MVYGVEGIKIKLTDRSDRNGRKGAFFEGHTTEFAVECTIFVYVTTYI